ncbi:MAG: hypothetical protein ACXIT4_13395 [Erythrobacter sp.]
MPFHNAHPRMLATLAIIRDKPFYQAGSAIRKASIFIAEPIGEADARFELREQTFDVCATTGQIMVRIATMIPLWSDVLMRSPVRTPEYNSLLDQGYPVLPLDDVQLLMKALPPQRGKLHPVHFTDAQMCTAAEQIGYAIPASQPSWAHHCLYADVEAQALWAAMVSRLRCEVHARQLLAARQAWEALQNARSKIP